MFALRLILRRIDKALDSIHAHISHAKASIRTEITMNHDETLAKLAGLTQAVNNLSAKSAAALAAKDQVIADLQA